MFDFLTDLFRAGSRKRKKKSPSFLRGIRQSTRRATARRKRTKGVVTFMTKNGPVAFHTKKSAKAKRRGRRDQRDGL